MPGATARSSHAPCARSWQAQGFSLWHDRQDMAGGRDWWLQITEAVERGVADVDERELAHRLDWTEAEYERLVELRADPTVCF